MKTSIAFLALAALLSGCATSPQSIEASYVSPVPYQRMSCSELKAEAQRVSSAAAVATGRQSQQFGTDAAMMTVSMLVFWPAIFFVGGDKGNAVELSNLKGQMDAIEAVNAEKNCGIAFQQG
jgi:uncharacterized lipoprotein YajG